VTRSEAEILCNSSLTGFAGSGVLLELAAYSSTLLGSPCPSIHFNRLGQLSLSTVFTQCHELSTLSWVHFRQVIKLSSYQCLAPWPHFPAPRHTAGQAALVTS
jgi:hypothetical protein